MAHHDNRGIACEAAGRFRGNVRRGVGDFDGRLAHVLRGAAGFGLQHGRLDVHDDLLAIARRPTIEIASQRAFGQPSERIGATLRGRHLVGQPLSVSRRC